MEFEANERYVFISLNLANILDRVADISEKVNGIHTIYEKLKQENDYLSEQRNEHVKSDISFKDHPHHLINEIELGNGVSNEHGISSNITMENEDDIYYVKEGCGCHKSRNPNRSCPCYCICSLF